MRERRVGVRLTSMLSYEYDSMELDDLLQEIEEDIRELHRELRKTA